MRPRTITAGRIGLGIFAIATKEDANGRKNREGRYVREPLNIPEHAEKMEIVGVFNYPYEISFSVITLRNGFAMDWRTALFPRDAVIWTDEEEARKR